MLRRWAHCAAERGTAAEGPPPSQRWTETSNHGPKALGFKPLAFGPTFHLQTIPTHSSIPCHRKRSPRSRTPYFQRGTSLVHTLAPTLIPACSRTAIAPSFCQHFVLNGPHQPESTAPRPLSGSR